MRKHTPVSDRAMLHYGHTRDGKCELCTVNIRDHYGVQLENEDWRWVCRECDRRFTLRKADVIDVDETVNVVFHERGRDWVMPGDVFIEALAKNKFTESCLDFYEKQGVLTLKQFQALIASSRNFTSGEES